jgi:hypothetical protein
MNDHLQRSLLRVLGAGVASIALFSGSVHAELVTTDQIVGEEQAQLDRERVKALIGRAEVAQELQVFGVPPAEAQARVDAMTNEEIRSIAGKLDALPAGGVLGHTELIIILLVVLLVVLLV